MFDNVTGQSFSTNPQTTEGLEEFDAPLVVIETSKEGKKTRRRRLAKERAAAKKAAATPVIETEQEEVAKTTSPVEIAVERDDRPQWEPALTEPIKDGEAWLFSCHGYKVVSGGRRRCTHLAIETEAIVPPLGFIRGRQGGRHVEEDDLILHVKCPSCAAKAYARRFGERVMTVFDACRQIRHNQERAEKRQTLWEERQARRVEREKREKMSGRVSGAFGSSGAGATAKARARKAAKSEASKVLRNAMKGKAAGGGKKK